VVPGFGAVLDANDGDRLEAFLAVMPCSATTPETQSALADVVTVMSPAVAAGFAARIAPQACVN
jgi:hypothetical protein